MTKHEKPDFCIDLYTYVTYHIRCHWGTHVCRTETFRHDERSVSSAAFARVDMAMPCSPKVVKEFTDILESHSTQMVLGYTKIHVAKKPSARTTTCTHSNIHTDMQYDINTLLTRVRSAIVQVAGGSGRSQKQKKHGLLEGRVVKPEYVGCSPSNRSGWWADVGRARPLARSSSRRGSAVQRPRL